MVNPLPPRLRLVLIGASNATVGLPTIVDLARQRAGEPLEIMAATGLGRSFGKISKISGREISAILDCRLWEDLESRPPIVTRAIVTDIGNDILYGEPVERIADWVSECIARLRERGAQVSLTQLPIANLPTLGPFRYAMFRRLFFPRCRLSREETFERVAALNERVMEIANNLQIPAISHVPTWYGLDPIHFKRRHRTTAWSEILAPLFADEFTARAKRGSWSRAVYLRALTPAERLVFGIRQRRAQPAGRLRDGTTISLY
jgi:hypothetical protein